jgi:predicted enzyme related to lactoylglutathione lyase
MLLDRRPAMALRVLMNAPAHTIVWTDIPVTDLKRAIAFYSKVLGQPVKLQKESDCEMGVLPHPENVSACLTPSPENKPSRTGPLIYLSVEGRLDDAAQAAGDNGGEVLEPKKQIGPYGYRALILDSEGNRIALHSTKA